MTGYSLWEVILNGDSSILTKVVDGVVQPIAPTTAEQRLAKKNKLKARETLLMDFPDKHQLKFNIYKDAKSLMEAIEKRFGGNKEIKKVQKTLLKQQYENFTGSSSKSLDQIHDRLQKLISQLEHLDLKDQSLDDLFNNLKIYEAEVKSSSSNSPTPQNIAFVSSQNTDSTTESVSVVTSVSTTSTKVLVSALPNVDNLSDAEMDLKWQMAMLTMRARRFLQKTGRNLGANGTTSIGFDMSNVECYNCHRRWYFARECMLPKDTRNKYTQRRNVPVESSTSNALVSQCDGVGSYDWSFQADEEPTNYALMAFTSSSSSSFDNEVAPCSKACSKAYVTLQSHYYKLTNDLKKSQFDVLSYKTGLESIEARLAVYQQNENMFEEDIKLLKLDVMLRDNALVELRKKFEKAEQERDELKLKLENFQTSSKNLNVSMPTSPMHDGYNSREGYHVVLPPYTGTFMPPKPDLVFYDAPTANETVPTVLNVEPSTTKPNKDLPSIKLIEHLIPDKNLRKDISKSRGHRHRWNRKACFVCKSLTHLIKDCDYYETKMVQKPVRNNAKRETHQHYVIMTHPYPLRHVVPTTVLTRSRLVPLAAARPVTTVVSQTKGKHQMQTKHAVNKAHLPITRSINLRTTPKNSNFHHQVTTIKAVKGNWGNPQHALKDKGIINSGCSTHMTGNISYLSYFEEINKGYVAFGGNPKGGKITGKGKIRTGKLDFDGVYFVKELKFNLFSVSQMCDKKNSVLFTDTECIVLSSNFKLPDENYVLLRVPRENNMYNVDLKNIVPSGDLTCLFVKATLDESNLWHIRLGHINFKTMNKLVKGNLVRGLPSKVFENNHTCVACKKGKQHRAFCKSKPVSSVSQPLQRFSWVFFLATKDETQTILKTFITGIESQINHKVKIIRSDNETKFKKHDLNQFYGMKGIKREFSVAITPQRNGIAERKNRTLIEATRTMLADLLLTIPFWAEAVNTACYVQNRVLVTKPHNKTPYELLLGRTPSVGFMRPFGCPDIILNTLDPLGKFDRKADEGFFVGYSVSSKAFRIFNSRTKIVQETLHINFLENQPNVVGSGPTWLFNIDTLTQSMNYQPVVVGNQPNSSADLHNTNAAAFEVKEPESAVHVSLSSCDKTKKHVTRLKKRLKERVLTNGVNATSTPVTAVGPNSTNSTNTFSVAGPSNNAVSLNFKLGGKYSFVDPSQYLDDPDMPALEDITYSDDEEDV
nr:hypothetical protein [Tanacetum cinerariifolium]